MWLSDGLDYGHAEQFADKLEQIAGGGSLTVLKPGAQEAPLAVGQRRAPKAACLPAGSLSGAEGPRVGHRPCADRPRRTAWRSTLHDRKTGETEAIGSLRPAA